MVKKTRTHNEWFRPVSPKRKSCPTCKAKLEQGERVWSWGEYHNARFLSITHFCKTCFPAAVLFHLTGHTEKCGCTVEFRFKGVIDPPAWLSLPGTDGKCQNEN